MNFKNISDKIKKIKKNFFKEDLKKNDRYIGSGYKGRGNINTDTSIFNHPRKDTKSGRQH